MTTIFDKPLDKQIASNTQAIANKVEKGNVTDGTYASYSSLSSMQTALVTFASEMGANKTRLILIYPNFTSTLFGGVVGYASISTSASNSYFSVLFHNCINVVHGKYVNGTWTWEAFAPNSDLTMLSSALTSSSVGYLATTIVSGSGTYRDNRIGYFYNEKYLILDGFIRIHTFSRTGSNPGVSATLPVSVADRYTYPIMTTAPQTEYATLHVNGTTFTITVSEYSANYNNSYMTIIVPKTIFARS